MLPVSIPSYEKTRLVVRRENVVVLPAQHGEGLSPALCRPSSFANVAEETQMCVQSAEYINLENQGKIF